MCCFSISTCYEVKKFQATPIKHDPGTSDGFFSNFRRAPPVLFISELSPPPSGEAITYDVCSPVFFFFFFTCLGVAWRSGTTPQSPCISGLAMITCGRSSVMSAAVCLDDSLTLRNTSVKCAVTTRTKKSPLHSVASAT